MLYLEATSFGIFILDYDEPDVMKPQSPTHEDCSQVYDQIFPCERHEHYTLKHGYMLMHGHLCVMKVRNKVVLETHAIRPTLHGTYGN